MRLDDFNIAEEELYLEKLCILLLLYDSYLKMLRSQHEDGNYFPQKLEKKYFRHFGPSIVV